MNTSEDTTPDSTSRPFGYWLKAVDRLMAAEFASAFEGDDVSRRDWRLLNIVDGTASGRRPLNAHKLHRLIERGWVAPEADGWILTDEGRIAKDRLGAIVDDIRQKVADAVPEEDLATTLASLEKIARAFGWDEETPLPHGRRHGFGRHGHRFAKRFGPQHGFGPRPGFGPQHGFGPHQGFGPQHGDFGAPDGGFNSDTECRHDSAHGGFDHGHHDGHHGHRRDHGPHRGARFAQHAYERGFDAGFTRGRDA
jgi:hypothetical protein